MLEERLVSLADGEGSLADEEEDRLLESLLEVVQLPAMLASDRGKLFTMLPRGRDKLPAVLARARK